MNLNLTSNLCNEKLSGYCEIHKASKKKYLRTQIIVYIVMLSVLIFKKISNKYYMIINTNAQMKYRFIALLHFFIENSMSKTE